ncbi:hypothetical protein HAX54_017105 [Datura stramonium]|uniref:Uncharacterized protein n=1 Tax=Datura stramonium TaxID=4076 RepID=A0ABS8ULA9_DATST|nr:hypothetical protein [Datura stramonium]
MFGPASYCRPVKHWRITDPTRETPVQRRIMSTSTQRGKAKALITNSRTQNAESDEDKRIDQIFFRSTRRRIIMSNSRRNDPSMQRFDLRLTPSRMTA